MNDSIAIRRKLDAESEYRRLLFPRAYLFTDRELDGLDQYPFYGQWQSYSVGIYQLLVHAPAQAYSCQLGDTSLALMGHAYNPFTGQSEEAEIVRDLIQAYCSGEHAFYDKLDQLTGVYVIFVVRGSEIMAVQDCGGQKMLYFGSVNGNVVISSTPQLAADVFGLERDPAVGELLRSKGYYRGSGFLPGNLSPYRELKRLGANTLVRYRDGAYLIERFFPREKLKPIRTEAEKADAVRQMHELMSANIALTLKKWPRAALSLTGGMDSKTALACAAAQCPQLYIYSFISKDSERLDADAAAEICRNLGLEHHLYQIPEDPGQITDYDFLQDLIEHNTSRICKIHPNEKRKYIWLERLDDFDVEIKSDISEIGRAYTTRKYMNVKVPRKLAPRHLTIGQGRYFPEWKMMRFADMAYESFMQETGLLGDIHGYSMHDLSYWEVRMASWAATSFASQEYFHEITIPYNNRNLMKLFLRFDEAERIRDIPHKRLMRFGNPNLADMDLRIKDSYFGKHRMLIETIYYYYATCLNTYRSKL